MKIILSDNIMLEKINTKNNEHSEVIKKLDNDSLIKKYIIGTFDNFKQLLSYYDLYNDELFNNVYAVRYNNNIVGVVELDGKENDLYLNYAILSKYRNKHIGSKLLNKVTKYLLTVTKKITLSIKDDNAASKKIAIKNGYRSSDKKILGYTNYEINRLSN